MGIFSAILIYLAHDLVQPFSSKFDFDSFRLSSIKSFNYASLKNTIELKTFRDFFSFCFKKYEKGKNRFSTLFVQQTVMIINGCNVYRLEEREEGRGERERGKVVEEGSGRKTEIESE